MSGLVLGGVLAGLALAGCTNPPADSASPSPEATSATPTVPASADPSPSVPAAPTVSVAETPSPSAAETTEDNAVTIDITIANGQVTPNGEKRNVEVGQPIVLFVSSDEDDEVHAHTSGAGYTLEVKAGTKVRGEFTLDSPGSYEVESHHLEKVIVVLNAR